MSDKSSGGSAAIVEVDLGERSYPIHIADGLLDDPALLAGHVRGRQALVVTDTMVAPLYLARVLRSLGNHEIESLVIPSGEASKSVETLNGIFDKLLACRFNRAATIVALGGGVVGDVAGFAAACYQRGVPYVQVPTTLLAQVDSSVGGKTAVNHRLGKNMIGAFYQPVAVLADIGTLRTLGPRDLRAGIAEVIKYGILWDREFFDWIEENLDDLVAGQPAPLAFAVRRSCEIKAEIVNADEREADVRALLNLGHTFGHAIEAGMGYGAWLHGEAVAAGMCMAAATAMRIGWLSPSERDRIDALIARAGLPTRAPAALSAKRLLELMALDKKVVDGGIRLVLPRGIGTTVVSADYPMPALTDTLESCRG